MPTENVFQPKQQRSQDTQRKLLNALHLCLKDKFFEHINIKELAEHAEVSVGTFYRRFKNKESLLPLLYQDFGVDLDEWASQLEARNYNDLRDVVDTLTHQMYIFLNAKKSVFRTLHLNARLHSEILFTDNGVNRQVIYQRLTNILLQFENEITTNDKESAVRMVIYTMTTSLLDKILYPDITPAIASELDGKAYADQLQIMLLTYLAR